MVNREINKPDRSLYIGLGWDRDDVVMKNPNAPDPSKSRAGSVNGSIVETEASVPLLDDDDKKDENEDGCLNTRKAKHYRRFYADELEKVKEVLPIETPFHQYDLKKGQSRGAKAGLWASLTGKVKKDASGEVSTVKNTGKFKAVIEVETAQAREAYNEEKNELFTDLVKSVRKICKDKGLEIYFEADVVEKEIAQADYRERIDTNKIIDFFGEGLDTIESRERIE